MKPPLCRMNFSTNQMSARAIPISQIIPKRSLDYFIETDDGLASSACNAQRAFGQADGAKTLPIRIGTGNDCVTAAFN